jgi:DNA-binding NarL/FixJ family response regulator
MVTSNIITLIIADDHELVRDGITTLINTFKDIKIVAEASNGEQLIQLAEKHLPDVILMDIQMPILDGIEATRIISKKFPGIGIIALSMMENVYKISDMIAAGASGYLLKDASKSEVIEGIRAVHDHKTYYCKGASQMIAAALASQTLHSGNSIKQLRFTPREKEISNLICEGFSTQEISKKLHLGTRTIEGYRTRLLQKTGSHNTAGLVFYIMQHNLYQS